LITINSCMKGICSTCVHESKCMMKGTEDRPVYDCEEFDCEESEKPQSEKPQSEKLYTG